MFALVGSGEYLAPMVPVDRELLALLPPTPRVVCLPTAAGQEGDAMIDDWMLRGVHHFAELGADAHGVRVWDRTSAEDATLAAEVASADLVYLSGGKPGYLADVLEATPVWEAIADVTARGGLLVGCSAGAMIQGERFLGGIRPRAGFGLWPGVHVVPHFDEIPAALVATMRLAVGREHTVVGVNGDTALLHDGEEIRVIGDEVTVWSPTERSVHGPGPLPADLLPG